MSYGQSVYGSVAGFEADQLSAMPSVHIGWALLVAVAIVHVSGSRWRWLALGYPALTTLALRRAGRPCRSAGLLRRKSDSTGHRETGCR